MTDMKATLRRVLNEPLVGFAPWILVVLVEGPGRVSLAAALGAALALATCAAGVAVNVRPKLLDVTAITFFTVLALVAALASAGTQRWLGVWSAEVSNVMIAAITGLSLAVRRPFTLPYARETNDREFWDLPIFWRINYVISAVWASAFLLISVVGYIGDGPLHQPNNIWTAWIVPIGLLILAIKFTGWYPDRAVAEAGLADDGQRGQHPVSDLLRPLAAYLVPVGILIMALGGPLWWAGAILVVAGIVAVRRLHQATRAARAANAVQLPVAPVGAMDR
jgi:hypothetical protein